MPIAVTPRAQERAMLLLHARAADRPAIEALLALDDRLGDVFATGREPMLRQIKLTWWRDTLAALDDRPPPAEPVLTALAASVLPCGVSGASLAAMAEGWALVLAEVDGDALARFATMVGATLFAALADVVGAPRDHRARAVGEGWALAHFARVALDPASRTLAAAMAAERLDATSIARWPRGSRMLGMLATLARSDLAGAAANTPRRAAALWRVRLFGR